MGAACPVLICSNTVFVFPSLSVTTSLYLCSNWSIYSCCDSFSEWSSIIVDMLSSSSWATTTCRIAASVVIRPWSCWCVPPATSLILMELQFPVWHQILVWLPCMGPPIFLSVSTHPWKLELAPCCPLQSVILFFMVDLAFTSLSSTIALVVSRWFARSLTQSTTFLEGMHPSVHPSWSNSRGTCKALS